MMPFAIVLFFFVEIRLDVVFVVKICFDVVVIRLALISSLDIIISRFFSRAVFTSRLDAQDHSIESIFVASKMQLEISCLRELTLAVGHGAGVRLFAGVKPRVSLEMRFLLEALFANVADEPPNVIVDEHVLRQQAFRSEYLVTDFTRDVTTRRRRFPRLQLIRFPVSLRRLLLQRMIAVGVVEI